MSIVKIEKVNIVFPTKLKNQVLDFLQEKGVAQIEDFEENIIKKYNNPPNPSRIPTVLRDGTDSYQEGVAECADCEYLAAEAQFAINFLEGFKKKAKKSLKEKLQDIREGGLLQVDKNKYQEVIKKFDYKKIIEQCKDLEEQINLHQNQITELNAEKNRFAAWSDLEVDFSHGLETENTKTIIGGIKTADREKLLDILAKGDENFEIQEVASDDTESKIIFSYLKTKEEIFKKALNAVNFKEADLSGVTSTVADKLVELEQKIAEHQKEVKKLTTAAKSLVKEQDNLKIVFDYYTSKISHHNAIDKTLNMNFVSIIKVWIPTQQIESLEQQLAKISSQINLIKVDLREGEEPPVALKNSNLIEPFEGVTNIYGLPKPNEVDPTWWLSLSFLIFFGFCLSDAGYGLILTAASILAIKILKMPREKQSMMRLIAYCGIFTFIAGALFGGWFGVDLDQLAPGPLSNFLLKIRLVNPMNDPLTVMYAAFALGFIHILWGIVAKFYQRWRDKQYVEAILDSGLWLYFLPVLVYWAITQSAIGKNLLLIGVAALVLTQGRTSKNILGKLFGGILSLYNVVGYFSDVLSYSRLLALGLATGVIAAIVNQIGGLLGEMIPYIGWLVMILVIIVGHIFNLAINVLGSYIHSSRLEFVEFFGKFMEGGGKMFEPFRKRFKYIVVK
jgi:V/A-type H+-transporting ATPase subunit I